MTVLANANTGLAADDVFYFGNAIGESGNSTTDAKVNIFDMLGTRDNQTTFLDALKLLTIPPPEAAAAEPQSPHTSPQAPSWLHEFEQTSMNRRPRQQDEPTKEAVDRLLARSGA